MRSLYFILALIGLTQAAMQQRSPVYPSATTSGVNIGNGQGVAKPSPIMSQSAPVSPATPTHTSLPVAQAREGTGASVPVPDSSLQSNAPNAAHSQNYLVYYYPEYRNVPGQAGATAAQAYGAPQEGGSIWSWSGWRDVGYIGAASVLIVGGGGLLYNTFGAPVKARALRELKDLKVEDAARMARSVLKAIERFRDMNTSTK